MRGRDEMDGQPERARMRDAVESINGPMGQAQMSGSELVNTAFSGSGRIDDIKGHPQSEIRRQTKLVKITEDVRKYAGEPGISKNEAPETGSKEESAEFLGKGGEVYAKA